MLNTACAAGADVVSQRKTRAALKDSLGGHRRDQFHRQFAHFADRHHRVNSNYPEYKEHQVHADEYNFSFQVRPVRRQCHK